MKITPRLLRATVSDALLHRPFIASAPLLKLRPAKSLPATHLCDAQGRQLGARAPEMGLAWSTRSPPPPPSPKFHDIFPGLHSSPRLGGGRLRLSHNSPQTQSLAFVKSELALLTTPGLRLSQHVNISQAIAQILAVNSLPWKRMTRATASTCMQEATCERKTGWA